MRNLLSRVVLVPAVAGSGTCATGGAFAQSTANMPGNLQSIQSAREVLRNATGRYCPSLFCTFSGYDIGAIDLTDNGQTIVFIHDDGTRGDELPIRSLNPRDLGLGVIGFSGGFEPQLVTTNVEVQRLIAALNTIKQAPPAELASLPAPTQLQTASVANGPAIAANPLPPSATAAGMSAASIAPVAPPPVSAPAAANTQSPLSSGYAGKRLAIKIIGNCAQDPDPTGFFGNDIYDECDADMQAEMRRRIASAVAAKNIFASVVDDNADVLLTITLTKVVDVGAAGGFLDEMAGGFQMTADYQLADLAGHILASGTVAFAESGDDDYDDVKQNWANKIASTVAANAPSAASSPSPAGAPAPPGASSTTASKPLQ